MIYDFIVCNCRIVCPLNICLSPKDIASTVNLPTSTDAEQYVFDIISDDEINAKIDQSDEMVKFFDDPEQYDGTSIIKKIDKVGIKSMVYFI